MKRIKRYLQLAMFIAMSTSTVLAGKPFLAKSVHSPIRENNTKRYETTIDTIGITGLGVVWDFSNMEKGSEIVYRSKPIGGDSVALCREMRASIVYVMNQDTLQTISYAKPGERLQFTVPEHGIAFPMIYGDRHSSLFYSEGSHGNKYLLNAGISNIEADGIGSLILPDNDTLQNVIRLHYSKVSGVLLAESAPKTGDKAVSVDSILNILSTDSITEITDRWLWYSASFPLPIVEKRETRILRFGKLIDSSHMAYYTPVSAQSETEPDEDEVETAERRMSERDRAENRKNGNIRSFRRSETHDKGDNGLAGRLTAEIRIYPTITNSIVNVECRDISQPGVLTVFDANGKLVERKEIEAGEVSHELDLSGQHSGAYIVNITAGGEKTSKAVFKY